MSKFALFVMLKIVVCIGSDGVLRISSGLTVLGGGGGPVMLMYVPMVVYGQTKCKKVGSDATGEKEMSKGHVVGSDRR